MDGTVLSRAPELTQNGWTKNWTRFRQIVRVLKIVRFSLIVVAIGIAAVFIDQGKEALIAMVNDTTGILKLQSGIFVLSALLLALPTWYFARVLFKFRFPDPVTDADMFPKLKEHLPRLLGGAMLLFPGTAVWIASGTFHWTVISLYALTGIFLYVVYQRRKLFKLDALVDETRNVKHFRVLPRRSRQAIIFALAVNPLFLILFTFFGDTVGILFGTPAVVMLALANLLTTGTLLVFWGAKFSLPTITIVIVLAILFGFVNDNHEVRTISESANSVNNNFANKDIQTVFSEWLDARVEEPNGGIIPVYLVSAEGGGIRAAYWTASVLSALQDADERFSKHVFSISGVSGGSLGGAIFSALAATPYTGKTCDNKTSINRCRAQQILKQDFLSPTVASLMFPDLVQRFLPVAIFDDRAQALEQAWEGAWQEYEDNDRFADPLISLWEESPRNIPLLFLNSTVVETGQRAIATPLQLGDKFSQVFSDAVDTRAALGEPVRLSTAVHTSARFTYVSPAGTIKRKDVKAGENHQWIRLVDGGYFENSGAVTSQEILNRIMDVELKPGVTIRPVVIHISNEPPSNITGNRRHGAVMSEVLSPVKALLHVRPGRGFQARDALAELVTQNYKGSYVHFGLCKKEGVTLPLGWMLSSKAQDEMNRQLFEMNNDKLQHLTTLLATGVGSARLDHNLEDCSS